MSVRNIVILSLFLLILGGTAGYLLRDGIASTAIQEKENQITQLREEATKLAISNKQLTARSQKKGGE